MTARVRTNELDEQTPLLHTSTLSSEEQLLSSSSSTVTLSTHTAPTPFPWRPVLVIFVLNGVQPLVFELVFPFINQMVLEIGVVDDPERVGFYSGVIESIFALMSFLFVLPCSLISDRYGRKPVVLVSITILALSTALFGFSKKYWFMVVTRSVGGISGASWSTMKVMLGELTDKSNQGTAFAGFSTSYRIGQILGQPIGGLLSHPERNFPLFEGRFWKAFPFALPCVVSASLALTAVIAGCFALSETKPSRVLKKGSQTCHDAISSEDGISKKKTESSSWRAVLTPHVISVLTSITTMVLASETLFALYPLFAFTPIEYGGLGLSEVAIGAHMAARSLICILLMFLFSPLQRRFGTLRTYQLTMSIWPLNIVFFPVLNLLARWGVTDLIMDAVVGALFVVWGLANLSWPASAIMVNDAAPSSDDLAALNGISQMAILLPQAIAPAFVTSVFAYSISSEILGGYLIWIVLFGISCIAAVHCLTLKEATQDWREDCTNQALD